MNKDILLLTVIIVGIFGYLVAYSMGPTFPQYVVEASPGGDSGGYGGDEDTGGYGGDTGEDTGGDSGGYGSSVMAGGYG